MHLLIILNQPHLGLDAESLSSLSFILCHLIYWRQVPADLEPGEYVLSFRWDCKCTRQVPTYLCVSSTCVSFHIIGNQFQLLLREMTFRFYSIHPSFIRCGLPAVTYLSSKCRTNYSAEIDYSNTRSLGAPRAPTSSWRPYGPLDFVLRALRALRPCEPGRKNQEIWKSVRQKYY